MSRLTEGQNISIEEATEAIINAIFEETFLNRESLRPKIKVYIKHLVDLKNTPKNYNAYESPNKAAIRLRTLEQRKEEARFWLDIVRALDPDNMQKHYSDMDKMLVAKGYKN